MHTGLHKDKNKIAKTMFAEKTQVREGLSLQAKIHIRSIFIIKMSITYLERFLLNLQFPSILTNSMTDTLLNFVSPLYSLPRQKTKLFRSGSGACSQWAKFMSTLNSLCAVCKQGSEKKNPAACPVQGNFPLGQVVPWAKAQQSHLPTKFLINKI